MLVDELPRWTGLFSWLDYSKSKVFVGYRDLMGMSCGALMFWTVLREWISVVLIRRDFSQCH